MLEMIEKVFAALIILSLLVIVLFLAFPEREGGIFGTSQTDEPAPVPTPPAPTAPAPITPPVQVTEGPRPEEAKEKENLVKMDKIEEKLPASKVVPQRRVNQTSISQGRPKSSEAAIRRRRYSRTYVKRTEFRDPWRRTDYYDCVGGFCDCTCDRPYWARSSPECWDW